MKKLLRDVVAVSGFVCLVAGTYELYSGGHALLVAGVLLLVPTVYTVLTGGGNAT